MTDEEQDMQVESDKHAQSDHQTDNEMLNMFASVWVKIEVKDEDASMSYENCESNRKYKKKSRKRDPRKHKILQCDHCDYNTVYKNCLELHVLGHYNTKPLSCEFCPYTTKYPTSLTRHVLIQHQFKKEDVDKNQVPIFKCDNCEYTSYFKWNLNAHKRKHKLEKQYKCNDCSYATAYRHNYLKHSKVHYKQEVLFKCDKCPFVTKFEGHITRHLAKIHNEITDKANKCDFCDFSTKTRWRLNIHKQRSRQDTTLKCNYCEFETVYMCESKKHKVTHYTEIYGCTKVLNPNNGQLENIHSKKASSNSICSNLQTNSSFTERNPETSSSYTDDTELSLEQNQHEKANHYTVDPNCGVDWNSIQVIESENKERPFQCTNCSYSSKFKASVQRHFQRHHTGSQNRPYKCTNCDFSTKTKDQIALHNKRSQSETELFCVVCKFTTNYKCQYVMHQKCHYAYKCTICSYSCKHKYEFQKHYAVAHLGDGLQCRYCDYKAARKESLLCHETIHTGNKPFKCTYCVYTSVRKSLLDNHLKRYHSEIKKDFVIVSESKIQSLKIPLVPELKPGEEEMWSNVIENATKNENVENVN